jgi:hypothetical protein
MPRFGEERFSSVGHPPTIYTGRGFVNRLLDTALECVM